MAGLKLSTRGLKYRWHKLLDTRKISIDGVWVSTDQADVPASVRRMLFRKTYEDQERDIINQVLHPKSKVLEIGTGIGLISILSRKLAHKGSVISFEANPRMEALIRKNYALNELEANLVMNAVTADGEDVSFYIDDEILSSSAIDREKGHTKITVKSSKFSSLLEKHSPETIIMDVEGAEVSLLDCKQLISVKNMIIEVHPHIVGEDTINTMLDKLNKQGFELTKKLGKVVLLENKAL